MLSCVIYVRRDYGIAVSPLTRRLPDGSLIYQFHFLTVALWEHSAQELLAGNLPGLLALLPLTRDGKDQAVIDEMIVRLQAHDNYEMLSLGYLFSSLTWTREDERKWIQRRFAMLRDELQESWAYQEILQEGMIKVLLAIVEARFPELLPQAKALVERAHDPLILQRLAIALSVARSTEEASQSLSNGASAA
ncbi:MAG: hypothetical protein ABI456_19530 [Ktedonobacteraceae bacterium]